MLVGASKEEEGVACSPGVMGDDVEDVTVEKLAEKEEAVKAAIAGAVDLAEEDGGGLPAKACKRRRTGSCSSFDEVAVEELSEDRVKLQQALSSTDAVLDPRCSAWLSEWCSHGETPESGAENDGGSNASNGGSKLKQQRKRRLQKDVDHAISMLSTGLSDYGESVAKLLAWIDLLSHGSGGAGGASGSSAQPNSKDGSSGVEAEPSKASLAAMEHFRSLGLSLFEPDKTTPFLEAAEDSPPTWLLQMLDSAFWRSMLIKLADKHANNPFLDFCVKAICAGGHHAEVAQLTTRSATYFAVFKQTFSDSLQEILDASDPSAGPGRKESQVTRLAGLEAKFLEFCFFSQYTYLFAVEVLEDLERRLASDKVMNNPEKLAKRCVLTRLRQTLLAYKSQPGDDQTARIARALVVEQTQPYNRRSHGGLSASTESGGIPELAHLVRESIKNNFLWPESLSRLRDMFDPAKNEFARNYPLSPVRTNEFIPLIIAVLFDAQKPPGEQVSQNGIYLLAVTVARPMPDSGSQIDNEDSTREAIEEAVQLCHSERTQATMHTGSERIKRLSELVKACPAVSAGVIYFTRRLITMEDFQRSTFFSEGVKSLLLLVRAAQKNHPSQRTIAFITLHLALGVSLKDISPSTLLELRKKMIDELIELMVSGFVTQVLDTITSQVSDDELDPLLTRHFVSQLAGAAAEPFSFEFARKTLDLLNKPQCVKCFKGLQGYHRAANELYQGLKTRCSNSIRAFNANHESNPVKAGTSASGSAALGAKTSLAPPAPHSAAPSGSSNSLSTKKFLIGLKPFDPKLQNNRNRS